MQYSFTDLREINKDLTKDKITLIYAYDEDFVGFYGYEDKFIIFCIERLFTLRHVNDIFLQVSTEECTGNQNICLNRELGRNTALFNRKYQNFNFRSYLCNRFLYQNLIINNS